MDLQERLGGYEVTAVPSGRPALALALVWSESADAVDAAGRDEGAPSFGVLALLDDYRITRVPGRAAS